MITRKSAQLVVSSLLRQSWKSLWARLLAWVFRFDIRLIAPLTRKLIVHYLGSLTAVTEKTAERA
ncbi:hypothetical protein KZZ08_15210 [Roseovarius mucosus]|uniref:hypothetical protein n=1 Tax=Roseovarius mucosus TaxID=215743 RepID=UPI001C5E61D1|nr:hypothetical protein [Roseovarius mucosus]MBW4974980.1 hypothetical protein [Roseovarius mucosus]